MASEKRRRFHFALQSKWDQTKAGGHNRQQNRISLFRQGRDFRTFPIIKSVSRLIQIIDDKDSPHSTGQPPSNHNPPGIPPDRSKNQTMKDSKISR